MNPARRAASILSPVDVNDGDTPDGWELVRCREILELKYGKGLIEEKRIKGPVPVFGSNGIVGYHNIAVTAGPTIIVGRKVSVGAVHYSPVPCWPIDTAYFVDEFSGLDPQYLAHALRSLNLVNLDTSTAVPGLNRNDAYDQMVPVPPLAEQARIVDQLERLRIHSDLATRRLARSSSILKRCRQSVLAAACSGRLTEDWREESPLESSNLPATWTVSPLADLTTTITSGSRDWSKYYGPGNATFVMAQNVRPGLLDLTHRQTVNPPADHRDRARTEVRRGDLLVTIVGENTGDVCPVDEDLTEHYICQSVALIRPISTELTPFLNLFLNSEEHGRHQLGEFIYGAGRPHLKFDQLKGIAVTLPPIEEQREILRRVETLFNLADAIDTRVAVATVLVNKFSKSILAKAFRGELVTTEAELARRSARVSPNMRVTLMGSTTTYKQTSG